MLGRRPALYVNARAIIERGQGPEREVLLQLRARRGEPRTLELPGGQVDPFEGIVQALCREVQEETGLTVSTFLDELNEVRGEGADTAVECLTPSFVYQTLRGPVDSVGFFFRVEAQGELTRRGDDAEGHEWITLPELRQRSRQHPETFNWLTRGVLPFYLRAVDARA
ncbi:NUDIX domain-containing protein [Deinococcus hohokamensis]|uniref:NUDIX domain-containing protein n=1 Tax=Deinococcus hohokamensis TaxID=309883 RepID=A0ABV9I6J0_9DEIO